MPESSLALGYLDFQREAGKFLGYGADADSFTTAESSDVDTLIDAGYRQVVYPPVLPGERVPYRWKFLNPTATLVTVASTGDYDLPDDFDGFEGPLRYNDQSNWGRIDLTSRDHILSLRQTTSNGMPRIGALTPREVGGILTARWKIMLWPTPAGAYTLIYKYRSTPPRLSAQQPYPVGGVGFGELVMESILSICEERKDDTQSVHRAKFVERLTAAVMDDRNTKAPDHFGRMMDPSTEFADVGYRQRELSAEAVTYNGSAE